MTDLERTLHRLVEDPSTRPTDLADIERRAGSLRLRRRLTTVAGVAGVAVVLGLAAVALPSAPASVPIIGEPDGSSSAVPTPTAVATAAPTIGPSEPAVATAPDASTPSEEAAPTTEPTIGETATANPETDPPAWVTTDELRAWQADTGKDGFWLPAYFFPADAWSNGDTFDLAPSDLVLRWRLLDEEAGDDRDLFVRATFEALAGAEPQEGLGNAFEGGAALDVMSHVYEGPGRATVVFTDELLPSNQTGSSGAIAKMQQMEAMFLHLFPEATEGCIATESTADDPESTTGFHDMQLCPFELRR